MAAKGERYQHNQITDTTYVVQQVKGSDVYLKAAGSGMIKVTLAQLAANYTKVS